MTMWILGLQIYTEDRLICFQNVFAENNFIWMHMYFPSLKKKTTIHFGYEKVNSLGYSKNTRLQVMIEQKMCFLIITPVWISNLFLTSYMYHTKETPGVDSFDIMTKVTVRILYNCFDGDSSLYQ